MKITFFGDIMIEPPILKGAKKGKGYDFNPIFAQAKKLFAESDYVVSNLDTPIGPISNLADFYIAHLLEIECVRQCVEKGITPPVWNSANAPGGDEKNAAYLAKYRPRVKML